MNVLDLFSGIGGFSLGLERAGMRTIQFVELDPFCRRVLAKHWPSVPIHDDIRTFEPGPADVICGGFPCQDISVAGKGAGLEGARSGLWTEFARCIRLVRPRYAIVENVSALLSRGMGAVLGDLAEIGYDAEWHCLPAAHVGAPHLRDRIWIVAHPRGNRYGQPFQPLGEHRSKVTTDARGDGATWPMADSYGSYGAAGKGTHDGLGWGWRAANALASAEGGTDWPAEPDLPRVAHGVPNQLDRVRALGNSIVPRIAEIIGKAIMRHANER